MTKNKVFNIDFLANQLDNNSVDAIITDPPYLINYKDWDNQAEDFHSMWLSECYRVLKPGGTIWSFMAHCSRDGETFISYEYYKLLKLFFNVDLRNSVVWARQKGRGASKHLKSQREDIFYATKAGGNVTYNPLKMLREVVTPYVKDGKPRGWFLDENGKRVRWTGLGNVWTYTAPQYNSKADKQIHPAQKPVMLMDRLIRLSSKEGDLILDPFIGSGTTAIACKLSNRNFVGFEKDMNIYKQCEARINDFDIKNYKDFNIYIK
jgi:site-specific DNA-methyltransferase (adenine-specific)